MTTPKNNPSLALTSALAIGTGITAMGIGYGAYHVVQRRRRAKSLGPAQPDPVAALQGVVGKASVADVPTMMQDVRQPILLRSTDEQPALAAEFDRVPVLRVNAPEDDDLEWDPFAAIFGTDREDELVIVEPDNDQQLYPTPGKAIGQLQTGLSSEATMMAYELALHEIANRGVSWPDDAAVVRILQAVAPRLDWSGGLKPFTYDSLPWRAWSGVQLVGTVANQSYWNKQVEG